MNGDHNEAAFIPGRIPLSESAFDPVLDEALGGFGEHRNEVWHDLYGVPLDATAGSAAAYLEATNQTDNDDYAGLVEWLRIEGRELLGHPYEEDLQDGRPPLRSDTARIEHTCPVAWAAEHGLLADDSIMKETWCLSHLAGRVLSCETTMTDPLRLYGPGDGLSVYYTPFDWVNVEARVLFVGITPGRRQADDALVAARSWLQLGRPNEQVLRHADFVGAFVGQTRTNLGHMLDEIGLQGHLRIASSRDLFDFRRDLACSASAITFPVFQNGENYHGHGPELVEHPVLWNLVRTSLVPVVTMVSQALVIPLGTAVERAVRRLVAEGILDGARCLFQLPHPSPAYPQREQRFRERREDLIAALDNWARTQIAPATTKRDRLPTSGTT